MTRDHHPSSSTPGPEHDPSCPFYVEPTRFAESTNAEGQPTLEVVDGSFEQSYRVGDVHTTKLFLALCRSRGLLPYRHRRQHSGTICVRATLTEHDAVWSRFVVLCGQLDNKLNEVTSAFVKAVEHEAPKR